MDNYKGVRDFYPEDQRVQNYLFDTLRRVVESFGYEEMNASVLEPTELYTSKSNDEMVREETYTFQDRGDRSVTLRPEMTPTVARMVASRKRELGYPLRWYSIQNFFRYDRQQRGRLREFWQLNADLFGVSGVEADIELIELAYRTLTAFGATSENFVLKVGSRSILQKAFDQAGLSSEVAKKVRTLIDKKAKMDPEAYATQMTALTDAPIEVLIQEVSGPLAEVMAALKARGISVEYDPSVVRGFEYYTDIVFEAFDTDPANARSILGGGRYDSLVEKYGSEPVAAVGFALGDVVLKDFLETHKLLPEVLPTTHLYLAPLGAPKGVHELVATLRDAGVRVAVGMKHEKIADHIKTALKLKIPFFAAYGDDEATSQALTVKSLNENTEEKIAFSDVPAFFANRE
jgi:histidyl-tRNA synthetase